MAANGIPSPYANISVKHVLFFWRASALITPFYTPFIELKKIYKNKDQKLANDSPSIAKSSVKMSANYLLNIVKIVNKTIIMIQLNLTAASEYCLALCT